MKAKDITGCRFGRLVAVRPLGKSASWQVQWECRCDCGRTVAIYKNNLIAGHTRSCGCLRSERMKQMNDEKHKATLGLPGTRGQG